MNRLLLLALVVAGSFLLSSADEEKRKDSTDATVTTTEAPEPKGWKVCFRNCAVAMVRVRKCGHVCGPWTMLIGFCVDNKPIAGFQKGDWIEFQQFRVTGWSSFGIQPVNEYYDNMTLEIEGDVLRGLAKFLMSMECDPPKPKKKKA